MIDFALISTLSPVFPLTLCTVLLLHNKQNFDKITWIIAGLILCSFSSDVFTYYMANNMISTYWLINLYHISELLILGVFFYQLIPIKQIVLSVTSLSFFYFIYQLVIVTPYYYYGQYFAIHSLLNISFCLYFFYHLFKKEDVIFLENSTTFWFVIGLLVYFSGSLFTYILSKQILNSALPYYFVQIANTLKNILFGIGLWKVKKLA